MEKIVQHKKKPRFVIRTAAREFDTCKIQFLMQKVL